MSLPPHFFDLNKTSAFSSPKEVARIAKQPERKVRAWIEKQDVWQRHKPVRYRFPQRQTTGDAIFTHIQADLGDWTPLANSNRGKRWMLLMVDCYSRYVIARALSRKTGAEVAAALEDCFKQIGTFPNYLITDLGKEFYNSNVKNLLREHHTELISPSSDQKAAICERMQRTIKGRMYKYFTHSGKRNWVTVLQKVVDGINNSHHRILKATPNEIVNGEKQPAPVKEFVSKKKFNVGDRVRLAKKKELFRKGYESGWTEEIFTIVRVLSTNPVTYHVVDDKGVLIKGIFYPQELVRVYV